MTSRAGQWPCMILHTRPIQYRAIYGTHLEKGQVLPCIIFFYIVYFKSYILKFLNEFSHFMKHIEKIRILRLFIPVPLIISASSYVYFMKYLHYTRDSLKLCSFVQHGRYICNRIGTTLNRHVQNRQFYFRKKS